MTTAAPAHAPVAPDALGIAPPRARGSAEVRARRGRGAWRSGRAAEATAARAYERRGWRVLARNWRAPRADGGGEIDLVMARGDLIAFVEVKARRTLEEAAWALGPAQTRRLLQAGARFLADADAMDRPARWDLVLFDARGTMEVRPNALFD